MRRFKYMFIGFAALGVVVFMIATSTRGMDPTRFDGIIGKGSDGALLFAAAGCASCHMAPGAAGAERLVLSGGQEFASPFGTFVAPNISVDAEYGIGGWTLPEFAEAIQSGVGLDGQHYYPILPYAAYAGMTPQEVADLKAYMDDLPASTVPDQPHRVGFPFNIRRSLGLWKMMFVDIRPVVAVDPGSPAERGRHLVETMAHCGECHTPRNAFGGLDRSRWLAGAPTPDGKATVPNITPAALNWSKDEIVTYLTEGTTPDFDFVGGHMAHVVDNMALLPRSDVEAIADYLKAVPPLATSVQP
jgi:mono/diheme cytochrome c family protein